MEVWLFPKDFIKFKKKKVIKQKLDTEIEFEEEFKMPEMAEQGNLENWSHLHPNIL